jgi:class 3 adenylate cyclase/CheY-like chemotaxis protein
MDPNAAISGYMDLFSKTSTFMSIDVVNSTQIKNGENEQDVIYTFLSYHKLIREVAYTYHGEITTISGDGVMCRFERPDDAAAAAQHILNELPGFNKRQNRLSQPFALRLGVNTGQVLENQSISAGQLISHTIDVAAKLQQTCLPNHVRFSQETVNLLKPDHLPLTRLEWDAALQTTLFQYGGSAEDRRAPRALPNPIRTLIIDDVLPELLKVKKILWTRHHQSMTAYTINQAALCMLAWKPHVVLLSADLAWDTGWELLKSLRADQTFSRIPVIVMSGKSTGETVERSIGLGANGFLKKPVEDQQMLKRVDMVLREFYL